MIHHTAVQSQKAVSAYFTSKQILPFWLCKTAKPIISLKSLFWRITIPFCFFSFGPTSPAHWVHDVVATLNQRLRRWFNVATTSCTQWAIGLSYPYNIHKIIVSDESQSLSVFLLSVLRHLHDRHRVRGLQHDHAGHGQLRVLHYNRDDQQIRAAGGNHRDRGHPAHRPHGVSTRLDPGRGALSRLLCDSGPLGRVWRHLADAVQQSVSV